MGARAHWASPDNPGLPTLNHLLLALGAGQVELRRLAKRGGRWQGPDARQFYAQVRALETALSAHARGRRGGADQREAVGAEPQAKTGCAWRSQLRTGPGERVAILAESSPEWLLADFACLAAGIIDVPIYPTLTPEQVGYILRDCGAVGIFVSNEAQADKVRSLGGALPQLRWLCSFESQEWAAMLAAAPDAADADFARRLRATPPAQIATYIYTSGTTGEPKGVVLTHANLCANLNISTLDFVYSDHERRLSILPLSHITERHMAYVDMLYGGEVYFAESLDKVADHLTELRPTVLVSVPRLFEKVVAAVEAQVARKPALARKIFRWALRTGTVCAPQRLRGQRLPPALALRWALADRLVARKVRQRLGGRLNKIISGGAPLAPAAAEFLLALGIVVDEGYGLTETSPVIALSSPAGRRPGSVGRPLRNLDVKIAADGEVLVRGPSVFGGYYRLPEETAAALENGWFHTGDIGRLDADGFLFLTDRKKDLIKTSGGKFIAPQPIEAKLKANPLVAEAVVVGDGRNFASVLLVPNWAAVEAAGLACSDRPAACADERVRQLFAAQLERVNATLARFETLKRFALLPQEFTIAGGELTPTIKVRRRSVEANYRLLIDSLYAEAVNQSLGKP